MADEWVGAHADRRPALTATKLLVPWAAAPTSWSSPRRTGCASSSRRRRALRADPRPWAATRSSRVALRPRERPSRSIRETCTGARSPRDCRASPTPSARPEAALELTVQHARDRHQFGRPIGSFQAVAHRCVDMRADLDACRYPRPPGGLGARPRRRPTSRWRRRRPTPTTPPPHLRARPPGARRHRLLDRARPAPVHPAGQGVRAVLRQHGAAPRAARDGHGAVGAVNDFAGRRSRAPRRSRRAPPRRSRRCRRRAAPTPSSAARGRRVRRHLSARASVAGDVVSSQLPNGVEALALCLRRRPGRGGPQPGRHDRAAASSASSATRPPRALFVDGARTTCSRPRPSRPLRAPARSPRRPRVPPLHVGLDRGAQRCAALRPHARSPSARRSAAYHGLAEDDGVRHAVAGRPHLRPPLRRSCSRSGSVPPSVLMARVGSRRFLALVEAERGDVQRRRDAVPARASSTTPISAASTSSSLRIFPCGGADVPPDLIRRARARLGMPGRSRLRLDRVPEHHERRRAGRARRQAGRDRRPSHRRQPGRASSTGRSRPAAPSCSSGTATAATTPRRSPPTAGSAPATSADSTTTATSS